MRQYLAGLTIAALVASAAHAPAQSPAGTQWDCILGGGGQEGIAFITFYDDGTFGGYELLSTRISKSPGSSNPRGGPVDATRNLDGITNGVTAITNLFGFGPISGPWGYDDRGRVVGHFAQLIGQDAEGNARYTNSVSFTGKVTPGKRLTMVASSRNGRITYSGVPFRETPDMSGPWTGVKVNKRQSFLEFFELTSVTVENPFGDQYWDLGEYPGIYFSLDGQGAGYDTLGFTMVSSRKKIGFAFQSTPWGDTNSVLNATFGSWSASKRGIKASATGVQEPLDRITFKASKAHLE